MNIGEQARVARSLSFSSPPKTPERAQVMEPPPALRPGTPVNTPSPLADPFRTPPRTSVPSSVSMERSPPSPHRVLCMPCAERALNFYERAHSDHLATEMFAKYVNFNGVPQAPSPVVLTKPSEQAFHRFIHTQANPSPVEATPKPPGAFPESTSWPDPYDGVM